MSNETEQMGKPAEPEAESTALAVTPVTPAAAMTRSVATTPRGQSQLSRHEIERRLNAVIQELRGLDRHIRESLHLFADKLLQFRDIYQQLHGRRPTHGEIKKALKLNIKTQRIGQIIGTKQMFTDMDTSKTFKMYEAARKANIELLKHQPGEQLSTDALVKIVNEAQSSEEVREAILAAKKPKQAPQKHVLLIRGTARGKVGEAWTDTDPHISYFDGKQDHQNDKNWSPMLARAAGSAIGELIHLADRRADIDSASNAATKFKEGGLTNEQADQLKGTEYRRLMAEYAAQYRQTIIEVASKGKSGEVKRMLEIMFGDDFEGAAMKIPALDIDSEVPPAPMTPLPARPVGSTKPPKKKRMKWEKQTSRGWGCGLYSIIRRSVGSYEVRWSGTILGFENNLKDAKKLAEEAKPTCPGKDDIFFQEDLKSAPAPTSPTLTASISTGSAAITQAASTSPTPTTVAPPSPALPAQTPTPAAPIQPTRSAAKKTVKEVTYGN